MHLHNVAPPADYVPPSRFEFESETGWESYLKYNNIMFESIGEVLHGEVYTPTIVQPGEKLPTILYVYGGPHVQVHLAKVYKDNDLLIVHILGSYKGIQ